MFRGWINRVEASLIFGGMLGAAAIVFLLFIRPQDLPAPALVSPFRHLDERKAAIYESLRDLQFEYRLNKLSDADYQATKLELQKELAHVLAEADRIKADLAQSAQAATRAGVVRVQPLTGKASQPVAVTPKTTASRKSVCPSCGAEFDKALKFCGECGKPMGVAG